MGIHPVRAGEDTRDSPSVSFIAVNRYRERVATEGTSRIIASATSLPNTTVSRSEFPPSRFAPWTLMQAHSPAA